RRTPLKQTYDSCFNSWFEGYLEPAVSTSSSAEGVCGVFQQKGRGVARELMRELEDMGVL
ncbi:hypothetical protein BYT27DRAFT_7273261, partial [Phlegmacium glaucopus]